MEFNLKYFLLILLSFLSFGLKAQIAGCTDVMAINYNALATENDGSCIYDSTAVSPVSAVGLNADISETSGLITWSNRLFTFNDSGDTNLYALDIANGKIIQTYPVPNVENRDWEAISQDQDFVYIGDFGNNEAGNRTDLRIYRIDKTGLLNGAPQVDIIRFSYDNQTDYAEMPDNTTDFDCEAFIVSADSIYLFTKQWKSNKSAIYSLPKVPGSYQAHFRGVLETNGMVTGATYLEDKNLVVLCGYSSMLQPFLFLLYDFNAHDFLSGNKRKLGLALPFYQIEGIATQNGEKYYLTNEYFKRGASIETYQQLHLIDLSGYLGGYLGNSTFNKSDAEIAVYPNPSNSTIIVAAQKAFIDMVFVIYTQAGKAVLHGKLMGNHNAINISTLSAGLYYLKIEGRRRYVFKVIKK